LFSTSEYTFGWWRFSDIHEIVELEASLNTRGVREHQLLQNLRKNLECCQEAAKKPVPDYLELDEPEHLEDLTILPYGCAAPDESGLFVCVFRYMLFCFINLFETQVLYNMLSFKRILWKTIFLCNFYEFVVFWGINKAASNK
jgi:hypothetical protein